MAYWMGKGHTGYKSMKHLPTSNGFDHFVGFLGGSQSYTSTDRWEDEHPLRTDADFVKPPPSCVPGGVPAVHATDTAGGAKCGISRYAHTSFTCDTVPTGVVTPVASAFACCALCAQKPTNCSHWTWAASTTSCSMWPGHCKAHSTRGATSGVMYHPPSPPHPPPSPPPPAKHHNDSKCHANTYSTTLYGELCLQTISAHDVAVPLFLYFPIQAVHTPYDPVPFNPTRDTYQGMLWDSDVYIGAIT